MRKQVLVALLVLLTGGAHADVADATKVMRDADATLVENFNKLADDSSSDRNLWATNYCLTYATQYASAAGMMVPVLVIDIPAYIRHAADDAFSGCRVNAARRGLDVDAQALKWKNQ
ncbi:hypothetical protein WL32_28155 [Burkholderia cepacia]|uniref:hypothetical protein n=1 Tax=Burkholderia cepacia TaxID=292 RepID=UPI0007581334|nr:hypothetical protein [Burkholderia cepacia]KWB16490.1 hypothetical protein WL32_28155 [Burkholderia cepacia]